jgi:hypothetical protein
MTEIWPDRIRNRKSPIRDTSGAGVTATHNNIASRRRDESSGETFVTVMQANDLRKGNDSSDPGWHDRAWVRTILGE